MSEKCLQEIIREEKRQAQEKRLVLLEDFLIQAKIAVPWMVKTLRHATDELHEGNYSDELKHAIAVKELLEKI